MICIKAKDLYNAIDSLRFLQKIKLRGSTAFKIARIIREIEPEVENLRNSVNLIIEKYAEKDENGNWLNEKYEYNILKDKIFEYKKELRELENSNVMLNVEPIELNEIEQEDFTIEQMLALEPYIKK